MLPEPLKTLFRLTSIKLTASKLGIKKLTVTETVGKIEFNQDTIIDPGSIVDLVQSEPHKYKLGAANQVMIYEKMENPEARFSKIEQLLGILAKNQVSVVG